MKKINLQRMCKLEEDIKYIIESNFSDDEKAEMINDEIFKDQVLDFLETNDNFGIEIKSLIDGDFNIMDYAQELTIDDFEKFSVPGVSTVQNTIPPVFTPGPGYKRTKVTLYKYASPSYGGSNIGQNSRSFCKRLVSITNTRLLTFEDIQALNGMNPGFGKGGTNNYSVFRFRGGSFCKHLWYKFIYNYETKTFEKAKSQDQPLQVPLR